MIIGGCEIIGIAIGDRLAALMPDHYAFYITIGIFLATTNGMIIFDLDPEINYVLIFL